MENQEDLLNKKVGDKEIPTLDAKEVEVQGVRVEEVGEKKNQIAVLMCKHPDREEVIDLSKIKLLRNDKATLSGLWVKTDEDKNIQKGTALAELLKLANVETLGDLTGVKLPTIRQSENIPYLCIKGY